MPQKIKVLIAPNSFKGSMNALVAADAIEKGLIRASENFEIIKTPIADGGDHFADIMTFALQGKMKKVATENALGEKIEAAYGVVEKNKTAIIEMAKASGLALIEHKKLEPLKASSYGTGLLIKDAIESGYKNIVLGIGGSATNDGGVGIAAALGVRFINQQEESFVPAGGTLKKIVNIDVSEAIDFLEGISIKIACDVENPLLGEHGAAAVFAPQKGASAEEVKTIEENLQQLAQIIEKSNGKKIGNLKHGGAAGGIAAGLFGLLDAQLVNGTDLVMEELSLLKKIQDCDVVITAEGKLDMQTLEGKGPYGIAIKAKETEKIVIGIGGSIPSTNTEKFKAFDAMFGLPDGPMTLEDAMQNGEQLLENLSCEIGKLMMAILRHPFSR